MASVVFREMVDKCVSVCSFESLLSIWRFFWKKAFSGRVARPTTRKGTRTVDEHAFGRACFASIVVGVFFDSYVIINISFLAPITGLRTNKSLDKATDTLADHAAVN